MTSSNTAAHRDDPGGGPGVVTTYTMSRCMTNLLRSTAALVDREPACTFADDETHEAALYLSWRLVARIREAGSAARRAGGVDGVRTGGGA